MNQIIPSKCLNVKHESQTHAMMNRMGATELADYLKQRLEREGWSQRTLAMYSEVSQPTIVRALKGDTLPEAENLRRIADALRIDQAFLFRKAGYITTPSDENIDPAARYIAQRLSQLPDDIKEQAIDAIGVQLDTISDLASKRKDEQIVGAITDGYHVMNRDESTVALLKLLRDTDPEEFAALMSSLEGDGNNQPDVDTSDDSGQDSESED